MRHALGRVIAGHATGELDEEPTLRLLQASAAQQVWQARWEGYGESPRTDHTAPWLRLPPQPRCGGYGSGHQPGWLWTLFFLWILHGLFFEQSSGSYQISLSLPSLWRHS
jgi:hypothetical protein